MSRPVMRFAVYPGPTARIIFAPLHLGIRDGLFAASGLDLQIVEAAGHPWTAVASGQAELGVSYLDYWFRAGLRGRFAVVGVHEVFSPGTGLTTLLARQDLLDSGALRSLADLAGRRVALLPGRGDDYMFIRGSLDQAALSFDDVTLVQVPHTGPAREEALADQSVDVLIGRRPADIAVSARSGLARWLTGHDVAPGLQARFLIAGSDVLARRGEDLTVFLGAYREATRRFWALWPELDEICELTGDSKDVLGAIPPPGFPLDLSVDRSRLAIELDILRQASLIPLDATDDGLVDLDPLHAAMEMNGL